MKAPVITHCLTKETYSEQLSLGGFVTRLTLPVLTQIKTARDVTWPYNILGITIV